MTGGSKYRKCGIITSAGAVGDAIIEQLLMCSSSSQVFSQKPGPASLPIITLT